MKPPGGIMRRVLPQLLLAPVALFGLLLWQSPAEAARSHSVTQTVPAPPGNFDMGTTQNITFRVANTSTGGNSGERIYQMRFRLSSGSTFTTATAAPAGWTRSAYSTTSVTFRASSWANAIPVGTPTDFTLTILMRTTTQDATTERLRDSRAYFTNSTTGTFNYLGRQTVNSPGSWQLRALSITSFLITDCAGTAVSSIAAGSNFCLIMTVKNISSTTLSTIVSVANPPAATKTGTVTNTLASTTYSPNPLTLARSASGTITFRYGTAAGDSGTIFFTAIARNASGTGSATSRSAVSPTLSISLFGASLAVTPTCQYRGYTITVTMTLTNGFPNPIINVTPTLTPSVGAPVTLLAGPTPAPPNGPVPANYAGNFVFTWTYQVDLAAAIGGTFSFSGFATGAQTPPGTSRTSLTSTSSAVRVGGFNVSINPSTTNATSTDEELTWTVDNQGCADVNQVAITVDPGWTPSGDSYSVVNNTLDVLVETWTVGGTTFQAPNATDRLPVGNSGDFLLGFSNTPAAAETSMFRVRVTDTAGQFRDVDTPVTVNPFDASTPGQSNYTGTGLWREEVH
jgi:hypothetical protein